jgi:hypothetical protein
MDNPSGRGSLVWRHWGRGLEHESLIYSVHRGGGRSLSCIACLGNRRRESHATRKLPRTGHCRTSIAITAPLFQREALGKSRLEAIRRKNRRDGFCRETGRLVPSNEVAPARIDGTPGLLPAEGAYITGDGTSDRSASVIFGRLSCGLPAPRPRD